MLGVFAAVVALCGALAPWVAVPVVVAACWGCYAAALGPRVDADLRTLALFGAVALLGRALSGPVERAVARRSRAAAASVEANPLFRADDRRRAGLRRGRTRMLAASLALGLAVATAVHARDGAASDAARERGRPVVATTLANAVPPHRTRAATTVVDVPARWDYPAGVRHTGRIVVFRWERAGTEVTVWVDGAGRLAPTPGSAPDRFVAALLVGLSASALAALLSGLLCLLLGRRLDLRTARAWAADWARVEPYWSGRRRNEDVGGGR